MSTDTVQSILAELKLLGKESYKRVLMNGHGVKEPCYGVAISELKKIQKRIRKDYQLALGLYDTGNYDAMYLAGLIADDARMTQKDLQRWVEKAYAGALTGATVAWVAAGSPHGHTMAVKWIDSPKPLIAATGWATLSGLVSVKPDEELDLAEIKSLLKRVKNTIHDAADLVRYQMNAYVISVGAYVAPLTGLAIETGEKIGEVTADLGNNSCAVPYSPDYIRKIEQRGTIGKKKKTVKC
ncbi:3-methyladenine DNA glycosylase AlkD [Roseimicrobium gellanilyticum]|uniref:3-methyladenine DNA glycosylase AlkD n=1 Tax=Roseimicrobium gellanilyticum TaxID=748857 RepID=A0A366HBI8_9BACT|nr:DNA alkylation repair protein [Roseimicrobium gellanilyticum]RBP39721.1 3-methyladenine DNA glycosylase AlkD [Roseimicrobium gellanilyticum]